MSIVTKQRFDSDRARLAELEAEFAANPAAPFVRENLGSYRKRVARNRLATPAPAPAAPPAPKPAAAAPRAAPPLDRATAIRRIGAGLGGTDAEIEDAIKSGMSAEAFALMLSEGTALDRLVAGVAAFLPTPTAPGKGSAWALRPT